MPEENSGALLHVMPFGAKFAGTRLAPLISIQSFCAIPGKPPAVFTVKITGPDGKVTMPGKLMLNNCAPGEEGLGRPVTPRPPVHLLLFALTREEYIMPMAGKILSSIRCMTSAAPFGGLEPPPLQKFV